MARTAIWFFGYCEEDEAEQIKAAFDAAKMRTTIAPHDVLDIRDYYDPTLFDDAGELVIPLRPFASNTRSSSATTTPGMKRPSTRTRRPVTTLQASRAERMNGPSTPCPGWSSKTAKMTSTWMRLANSSMPERRDRRA